MAIKDKQSRTHLLLLVAILLLAAVFRLVALNSIPPGLHPDAAVNAIDAWRAASTHHRQVFYEANFGREGLLINLISYSFQWFGPNVVTYKLPSALIGVITVAGMYVLGRLIGKKRRVGLLAAFFTAISLWMTLFDRTGLRASVSVCCVVWTLNFFFLALRTRRWYWYLLTGLMLGSGLNTYISFRLMPIIVIIGFLYDGWYHGKSGQQPWRTWLNQHRAIWLTIVTSLVVALPLIMFFVYHPEYIMGRANDVSVFTQPHWLLLLVSSTIANLSIFTFFGDPNWRHNISTQPLLDGAQAILFIVGLVMLWRRVRRARHRDVSIDAIDPTEVFTLLALFIAMIIPAATTFSPGGIPHALRIIDTAPAVYMFVALGASVIIDWAHQNYPTHQRRTNRIIAVAAVILVVTSAVQYFGRWGMSKQVAHEFSQDYTAVANFADHQAKKGSRVYVLSNSTEIEFLTINRPMIRFTATANATEVNEFTPEYFIDTTGNGALADVFRGLGWTEPAHPAWGEGAHGITLLERPH